MWILFPYLRDELDCKITIYLFSRIARLIHRNCSTPYIKFIFQMAFMHLNFDIRAVCILSVHISLCVHANHYPSNISRILVSYGLHYIFGIHFVKSIFRVMNDMHITWIFTSRNYAQILSIHQIHQFILPVYKTTSRHQNQLIVSHTNLALPHYKMHTKENHANMTTHSLVTKFSVIHSDTFPWCHYHSDTATTAMIYYIIVFEATVWLIKMTVKSIPCNMNKRATYIPTANMSLHISHHIHYTAAAFFLYNGQFFI